LGSGGRGANLIGIAPSASQGTISQTDIQDRPILRVPDVLEAIPGLIATVDQGGVRTNLYLRGFNLQHGTDFATFLDGVPLNLPSHVHSQGFTDLNFMIPEILRGIDYGKGPYYPEVGDFSSVGYASIDTFSVLPYSFAKFEYGQFNYWRVVMGDSPELGPGVLLYAFETRKYDGPWDVPEDLRQFKAFTKYTIADQCGGMALSFLAFNSQWTSTQPIPLRAVNSGLIGRFGSLDPTDGGVTNRYAVNQQYWKKWDDDSFTKGNAFFTYYSTNFFENETFFIDDPVGGDQIVETDRRFITGLNLAHTVPTTFFGRESKNTFGVQVRQDWIPTNNHDGTSMRVLVDPLLDANISIFTGGLYYKNETKWLDKLRTVGGFRGDYYNFTVDEHLTPANSGNAKANIFSPKGSVILGPWCDTEYYLNAGMSFHSNDAKGVTTTVDPATGDPLTPVPALVQTRGAEVGLRSRLIPNLTVTGALWYLELDSELVFQGDMGITEPKPGSHRYGAECSAVYQFNDWLRGFADYSDSYARFADFNPEGQFVPGALETVVAGGMTARACNGLYATWYLRYFGPRPLIGDNSVRSANTTQVNLETGWERERFKIAVTFLNLFNSHDHDVDFFFASRLPGEPLEGVPDIHFRPLEPFGARLAVTYKW
jgi:hypothetical protein